MYPKLITRTAAEESKISAFAYLENASLINILLKAVSLSELSIIIHTPMANISPAVEKVKIAVFLS